jgi:hypothetical protein
MDKTKKPKSKKYVMLLSCKTHIRTQRENQGQTDEKKQTYFFRLWLKEAVFLFSFFLSPFLSLILLLP